MKWLGNLLVLLGTVVGVTVATTAYSPRVGSEANHLVGLTLNDPAGVRELADGTREPLLPEDTVLTAADLVELQTAGVTRVKVKEFAWSRWPEAPYFAIACLTMIGGAVLVRVSRRGRDADDATHPSQMAAVEVLRQIDGTVGELETALAGDQDSADLCDRVLVVVSGLQKGPVTDFVAHREELLARGGMSGYAQVMDRFAAAERQLNRAWSAAADGVLDEARLSIERAGALLRETAVRLDSVVAGGRATS